MEIKSEESDPQESQQEIDAHSNQGNSWTQPISRVSALSRHIVESIKAYGSGFLEPGSAIVNMKRTLLDFKGVKKKEREPKNSLVRYKTEENLSKSLGRRSKLIKEKIISNRRKSVVVDDDSSLHKVLSQPSKDEDIDHLEAHDISKMKKNLNKRRLEQI